MPKSISRMSSKSWSLRSIRFSTFTTLQLTERCALKSIDAIQQRKAAAAAEDDAE
jgi:hypothetical protein